MKDLNIVNMHTCFLFCCLFSAFHSTPIAPSLSFFQSIYIFSLYYIACIIVNHLKKIFFACARYSYQYIYMEMNMSLLRSKACFSILLFLYCWALFLPQTHLVNRYANNSCSPLRVALERKEMIYGPDTHN